MSKFDNITIGKKLKVWFWDGSRQIKIMEEPEWIQV